MLSRFLSLTIGVLIFSASLAAEAEDPSPFAHDSLGKCFENVEMFIRIEMGEQSLTDPNLNRTTKGSWTWVVDQTATQNYTWYLLEKKDNKVCLQVFVPAASHVEFKKTHSSIRVEAFIAPLPGLQPKLIEFRPTPQSNIFLPTRCFILRDKSLLNRKLRSAISCDHIFE